MGQCLRVHADAVVLHLQLYEAAGSETADFNGAFSFFIFDTVINGILYQGLQKEFYNFFLFYAFFYRN